MAMLRLRLTEGFRPTPSEVVTSEVAAIISGDIPYFVVSSQGSQSIVSDGCDMQIPAFRLDPVVSVPFITHWKTPGEIALCPESSASLRAILSVNTNQTLSFVGPGAVAQCALDLAHAALNSGMLEQQEVELGLYGGWAGLLFLFACAYAATGDSYCEGKVRVLANGLAAKAASSDLGLSMSSGAGGIAYALAVTASVLQDSAFLQDAVRVATSVTLKDINNDVYIDIISGVAGYACCIASLIERSQSFKLEVSEALYIRLLACATHLIEQATPQPVGMAWSTHLTKDYGYPPLYGFSHGAAGCCYALQRCNQVLITPDAKLAEIASLGMAFEDVGYHDGNWKDRRGLSDTDMFGWCHGGAGIALSRWIATSDEPKPSTLHRLHGVVDNITCKNVNLTLCCGAIGCVDACITMGETPSSAVETLLRKHLYGVHPSKLQCKPQHSLFKGLAGISYVLFHYLKPDSVPSVLVME